MTDEATTTETTTAATDATTTETTTAATDAATTTATDAAEATTTETTTAATDAATTTATDAATTTAATDAATTGTVSIDVPVEHQSLLERAAALLKKGDQWIVDNIEAGIAHFEGLFKSDSGEHEKDDTL